MGNAIPAKARDQVRARSKHRCERCAVPAPQGQWHHRRSRGVRGPHRHCPCNGVWLCPTCHRWAHDNPVEARALGWVLGRFVEEPAGITVATVWGRRHHDCEGGFVFV